MGIISNSKVRNLPAFPNSAGRLGDPNATANLVSKFCHIINKVVVGPGNQASASLNDMLFRLPLLQISMTCCLPLSTTCSTVEDVSTALDDMLLRLPLLQLSTPLHELGHSGNGDAVAAMAMAEHQKGEVGIYIS